MKKFYKNIIVVPSLFLLSLFTFVGMIYATTFVSSLSLDGASLTCVDFVENFGRLSAGKRYYYFSTYHGGVDYGLVYAPNGNVVMSSYST